MAPYRPPEPIPLSALFLGLAGLIPFIIAASVVWAYPAYRSEALMAGIAYGAVILSFLGGIRWGTAIGPYAPARLRREFTLSVLPPLAGWAALLLPELPGLCLLISGFLLQGLRDVVSVEAGRLPPWFGRLRMMMTVAVAASLLAIAGGLALLSG
jgi:hypothetical protein